MKKALLSLAFLAAFSCCKKEEFASYRIMEARKGNTFACLYVAKAKDNPEIRFYDECGKYAIGETIKVQMK